jgi:hypothetical protein
MTSDLTHPIDLAAGTRIELFGGEDFGVKPEMATIARWTTVSGDKRPGWHIVKFSDGGRLCVHETRFRVIDNG